jgi:hypothetical protein
MFEKAQTFVRGMAAALELEARQAGVLRSVEATHVSRWLHALGNGLYQASQQEYVGKTLLLYGASSPDDLRELGWYVAVHNDYYQGGAHHTFWLMTKGTTCFKGEGLTDEAALDLIRKQVEEHAA